MNRALQLIFVITSLFLLSGERVSAQQTGPDSSKSLLSGSFRSDSKTSPSSELDAAAVDAYKDILSSSLKVSRSSSEVSKILDPVNQIMNSGIVSNNLTPPVSMDDAFKEIKNPATQKILKDTAQNIASRKSVDFKQVITDLAKIEADERIEKSNLSANQKKLAQGVVAELAGEDGALLNATSEHIQAKLTKAGIPADSAKNIAAGICTFVSDTDNFAALKDASSELAQDLVTKYVGSKGAATINSAIEEYMSAEGTAKSAAKKTLNTAIDQYVRDPASNAALKQTVVNIENGKTPDYLTVATTLAKHGADKLIDDSQLSANEKKLAHALIADLAGEDGALLNATGAHIQAKLIKAGVAEETAKSISGNIQSFLADTGNIAALKAAGSESLQELVSRCVDEKGAATINSAIREYMSAEGTAKSAAVTALNTAIDQYVRDPASNAALKKALGDLNAGESIDYMEVGTALARHGADKLIDGSDLTANQKKLAHALIADLAGEDGAFLNATEDYIKAKLIKSGEFPEETAAQVAELVRSFLDNTGNTAALKGAASISMQELVNQYVGGKGAEVINSGIREIMSAEGSAKSTAVSVLNTAIDQYVRDPASNAALKKAVSDLQQGKSVDYKGTATTLARSGADSLIDKSNLSASQKKLAHELVAELAGEEGALLNATGEYLKEKMIKKGIPADKAASISGNIQTFLADTGNTAAIKAAATDAAQSIVSKYVDDKGAAVINTAIANYMGEKGTVGSAAEAALNAAIDQYVKGDDAKKALREALERSRNGQSVNYTEVGSTVFNSYARDYIENSKMSPEAKEAALSALNSLKGEVPWSETGAEALEAVMVKAGLDKEQAANLSRGIIDYVKGNGDLGSLVDGAKSIFSSKVAKAIDEQLKKWEEKFPFINELYKMFGIERGDIVKFFQNLSFSDIKNAFASISKMSLEDWKNIGKQLVERLSKYIAEKITQALTKLATKITEWFKNSVKKILGKIHFLENYMDLIGCALDVAGDMTLNSAKELIKTGVDQIGGQLMDIWIGNGSSGGEANGN